MFFVFEGQKLTSSIYNEKRLIEKVSPMREKTSKIFKLKRPNVVMSFSSF